MDPLAQGNQPSAMADVSGKKARFVSEGHIAPLVGGAFGYGMPSAHQPGQGQQQQTPQQQQQQANLAALAVGLGAAPPPGDASGATAGGFGAGNASRSFSGNLPLGGAHAMNGGQLSANSFGAPNSAGGFTNPLGLGANAAALLAASAATGPMSNGSSNGGSPFGPLSAGPQNAHFLMGPSSATLGSPSAMSSAMFGGFPPSAFGLSPNALAGFMPNLGLGGSPNQNTAQGRTVYVGNLPAEASVDELLNQVKFGPIESVKVLPEKNCAFISFLDGATAAAFHADASVKKLGLHNHELKIGWGKPSPCPAAVAMAVQNQATRNVYLGQLDDDVTEQSLRDDLTRFGPIDQVKIVRDKNIGFVHFLSIGTAMKVVATLPTEPAWAGKRVNYGKDRCAYVPKSQQQNQAHNSQAAAMGLAAAASLGYPTTFSPTLSAGFGTFGGVPASAPAGMSFGIEEAQRSPVGPQGQMLQQIGNRTVYLGNIHPETTIEEICNHIRGGILQSIRYIPEKHIAFVTFVDPNAALAFCHLASYSGVMIHNRRLKIGWGKHSGPLSPAIAMAVQAGGSRNVYVGNIEDFDTITEDKLRRDFGEYGEIELVNSLREKNCAFVNFCNIQNAIKAIEAMKNHADYATVKIAYGKDRCGNPPRSVQQGLGGRKSSASFAPGTPSANLGDESTGSASSAVPKSAPATKTETVEAAAPISVGAVVPSAEDVEEAP